MLSFKKFKWCHFEWVTKIVMGLFCQNVHPVFFWPLKSKSANSWWGKMLTFLGKFQWFTKETRSCKEHGNSKFQTKCPKLNGRKIEIVNLNLNFHFEIHSLILLITKTHSQRSTYFEYSSSSGEARSCTGFTFRLKNLPKHDLTGTPMWLSLTKKVRSSCSST